MSLEGIQRIVRHTPAFADVHIMVYQGRAYSPNDILRTVQSGQATPDFLQHAEHAGKYPNLTLDQLSLLSAQQMVDHANQGTTVKSLSFHARSDMPRLMDSAQAAVEIQKKSEIGRIFAESHGKMLEEMKKRSRNER